MSSSYLNYYLFLGIYVKTEHFGTFNTLSVTCAVGEL